MSYLFYADIRHMYNRRWTRQFGDKYHIKYKIVSVGVFCKELNQSLFKLPLKFSGLANHELNSHFKSATGYGT